MVEQIKRAYHSWTLYTLVFVFIGAVEFFNRFGRLFQ